MIKHIVFVRDFLEAISRPYKKMYTLCEAGFLDTAKRRWLTHCSCFSINLTNGKGTKLWQNCEKWIITRFFFTFDCLDTKMVFVSDVSVWKLIDKRSKQTKNIGFNLFVKKKSWMRQDIYLRRDLFFWGHGRRFHWLHFHPQLLA